MADKAKSLTIKQLQKKNYGCTDKVISDLKYGLMRDFTVMEACTYARINPDTYYRWVKESDDFAEEMVIAQQHMSNLAKKVIMDTLEDGDKDSAKWWLERRRKENYALRQETQHSGIIKTDSKVTFVDGTESS